MVTDTTRGYRWRGERESEREKKESERNEAEPSENQEPDSGPCRVSWIADVSSLGTERRLPELPLWAMVPRRNADLIYAVRSAQAPRSIDAASVSLSFSLPGLARHGRHTLIVVSLKRLVLIPPESKMCGRTRSLRMTQPAHGVAETFPRIGLRAFHGLFWVC